MTEPEDSLEAVRCFVTLAADRAEIGDPDGTVAAIERLTADIYARHPDVRVRRAVSSGFI